MNNSGNVDCIIDSIVEKFFDYWRGIHKELKAYPTAKEAFMELFRLKSDVVETVREIANNYFQRVEIADRSCFITSVVLVVYPAMDQALAAFVTGSLPLCFHALRVSLEALTSGFYLDLSEKSEARAIDRLEGFRKKFDTKEISSFSYFLKNLLPVDEETSEAVLDVWSRTSNDFLHFKGYVKKIRRWENEVKDTPPPSFLTGAFVPYSESDDEDLRELMEVVKKTKQILGTLFSRWKAGYQSQ
ncbi:MAG: hypothetical protein QW470_07735 [Candidatus Caldarchaeum sp.]